MLDSAIVVSLSVCVCVGGQLPCGFLFFVFRKKPLVFLLRPPCDWSLVHFLFSEKSQQTKQKHTKVNMVEDEKTDNLDGIVDMSHRCVDIETTKREKKKEEEVTISRSKLPVFPSSRLLERFFGL